MSKKLADTAAAKEARAQSRILEWPVDPVKFWSDVCGFKPVSYQGRVARAVAGDRLENPKKLKRFCLASGHNVGKSAMLANLAVWYSWTRPGSIVLVTGPTFERQVVSLFHEIRKWYGGYVQQSLFELDKARLRWPRTPLMDELHLGEWAVLGMSASEPQNLAGKHSPQGVMVIIDEASVVDDGVFQVLEGAMSDAKSDIRLVLAGNPTRRDGEFYRAAFDPKYADLYWRLQISSVDSEIADTAEWAMQMLRRYGEDSPVYRSRVLGLPPDDNPESLISFDSVVKAESKWEENKGMPRPERAKIGVDVAWEGGDESVVCVRKGQRVEEMRAMFGYDSVEIAEAVVECVKSLNGIYDSVYVDSIGYGAGVIASLKRMSIDGKPIRCVPVNVARRAQQPDEFFNLRAELYFRLRDFIKHGEIPPATPTDDKLRQDLLDIRVNFGTGRALIEPKEQIRKRLKRSPDRSDALMLTFAQALGTDWATVAKETLDAERWGTTIPDSYESLSDRMCL